MHHCAQQSIEYCFIHDDIWSVIKKILYTAYGGRIIIFSVLENDAYTVDIAVSQKVQYQICRANSMGLLPDT